MDTDIKIRVYLCPSVVKKNLNLMDIRLRQALLKLMLEHFVASRTGQGRIKVNEDALQRLEIVSK